MPRAPRLRPTRLVASALGLVLLVVGGWLGYQYWASGIVARGIAERAVAELRGTWAADGPSKRPGAPVHIGDGEWFALLRVPAFGDEYEWPIGSGEGALAGGIAWYPDSAQPGQIGNVALAGDRITHGAPFARLLELKVGDQIIIETRDVVYAYRLKVAPADLTVRSDAAWVLDPVPGKTDVVPWESIVTLTTAQDLVISPDRSVAFGALETKEVKS